MRFSTSAIIAAIAALCSGCSTIIEGTSQELYVNTNPAGASCWLMREGRQIATINPTPGTALVQKTKNDITVVCDRDGFQQATYLNHSGVAGATAGNIILGGGIGWAIDSATGSDNKYDSPVNLTLVPKSAMSVPGLRPSTPAAPIALLPPSAPPVPVSLAPAPVPVVPNEPVALVAAAPAPAAVCPPGLNPKWTHPDMGGTPIMICIQGNKYPAFLPPTR